MPDLQLTTPKIESVAALAERYLEPHQPPDYRIVVRHDGIRRFNGRWFVLVDTDRPDVSSVDFVERYTDAEAEIERDYPGYLRLTTGLPESGELA